MGEVFTPPEIKDTSSPLVFLAGPIQGAPDWQAQAINTIMELDDEIDIASPRRDYPPGEFEYNAQVDWETHNLVRAATFGAIMFWFARQDHEIRDEGAEFPRSYAQTSREELGEWRNRYSEAPYNLVVGIEAGAGGERYIRRRLGQECPDVPILSSLPATCISSVQLIRA